MKVKNIAFSGFAAAILTTGVASAAAVPQIASKSYVDKIGTQVKTLNTTLTENYTTTEELGDVITTNITQALESDTSAISEALAKKVDTSDTTGTIADETDETKIPTVGAVTMYTQTAINEKFEGGVSGSDIANGAVGTDQIANKAVTSEKLSDELNEKIDAAQTADDVATAIGDAVTADGALKNALADKADKITVEAAQVGNIATVDGNGQYQVGTIKATDLVTSDSVSTAISTAIGTGGTIDTAIDDKIDAAVEQNGAVYNALLPRPGDTCKTGMCVLSVNDEGTLKWVDVTQPYGDAQE